MGVRVGALAALGLAAAVLAGCGRARDRPPRSRPCPTRRSHAHPQAVEPIAGAAAQASSVRGPAGGPAGPTSVSVGPSSGPLAQPVSDAQVRRELAASGLSANARQATLTTNGLAIAPINAPASVQAVIQAGNEIAHLPYVWGGGHATVRRHRL